MPKYTRPFAPEEELTDDELDDNLNNDPKLEPRNQENATWKKRYGDLRSHTQKQLNEMKAELEKLKAENNAVASRHVDLPASPDEVEAWSRKYPKIAAVFETLAIQKYKSLNETVEERFKELDKRSAATAAEQALVDLKKIHNDFDSIQNNEDFHAWLATKSKRTQDSIYENDLDYMAAAETITLFKLETNFGRGKKPTVNPKDAARDVPSRSPSRPSGNGGNDFVIRESEIEAMSPAEYDANEEAIEKAIKEGRVEYDISTAAKDAARG